MEKLQYINKNPLLRDNLIRIGDLFNFEGPLLTLYQDVASPDLYLCEWVERSDEANRWLVYKVEAALLLDFINKKINQYELFVNSRNEDSSYYVSDIKGGYWMSNSDLMEIAAVPETYIPSPEAFFDEADCPAFSRIQGFLLSRVSWKSHFSKPSHAKENILSSLGSKYNEKVNNWEVGIAHGFTLMEAA